MKVEISERKIIKVANVYYKVNKKYPEDIKEALDLGRAFHEAGLRPFYVYDQVKQKFIVTSRENIDKHFN